MSFLGIRRKVCCEELVCDHYLTCISSWKSCTYSYLQNGSSFPMLVCHVLTREVYRKGSDVCWQTLPPFSRSYCTALKWRLGLVTNDRETKKQFEFQNKSTSYLHHFFYYICWDSSFMSSRHCHIVFQLVPTKKSKTIGSHPCNLDYNPQVAVKVR
jgi:hypothetical protein